MNYSHVFIFLNIASPPFSSKNCLDLRHWALWNKWAILPFTPRWWSEDQVVPHLKSILKWPDQVLQGRGQRQAQTQPQDEGTAPSKNRYFLHSPKTRWIIVTCPQNYAEIIKISLLHQLGAKASNTIVVLIYFCLPLSAASESLAESPKTEISCSD